MPHRRSLSEQSSLCVLVLGLAMSLTGPASAERLLARTYTVADGLASSHITSLVTDRDGFLWVCGRGGVSRFDGTAFTAFRIASRGLPASSINHFLQTRTGTRWMATNGDGVVRLDARTTTERDDVFESFPVGTTDRSMNVNALFETGDGDLLAGTDGGLFRSPLAEGDPAFELVPLELPGTPDGSLQIWSMTEDPAGDLWIGTSAGLARLSSDGRAEQVPVRPLQGADHVWSVVVDDASRLWLGHDLGLVVWLPPRSAAPLTASSDREPLLDRAVPCARSVGAGVPVALPTAPGHACHWTPPDVPGTADRLVSPELRTADGVLWLAYRYGLVSFDGTRFQVYSEPEADPSWTPATVAQDPGGDLWVKSTRGVARVSRQGFTQHTTEDGLTERVVERIFRGPDQNLFAVTRSSRIHRFDGGGWTAVRPNVPVEVGRGGRSRYGAVLVDHRGEWWVGGGDGLYRFPPVAAIEELTYTSPRAHYTTADGLAGNDVARLFEDSRGDLWITARVPVDASLARWRRRTGELRRFGHAQGLPAQQTIWGFAEDLAGGLWVSTSSGLFRFDGTRFGGLTPGRELPPGGVGGAIHVDDRGRLWATVGGIPVLVADPAAAPPHVSSYPLARDLTAGPFGVLGSDAVGRVYLRSSGGLAQLEPDSGNYRELGIGAPFTTVEQAFRDDDGTLWFPTADGILRYRLAPLPASRPPPVWIRGVRVAGVARWVPPMGLSSVGPLRLKATQQQMQIDYFGLGFGLDEPLRFQVRLDGADTAWSRPTKRRSVLYAGLGSGHYRFRVRAVSATGRVSAHPATLAFTLPPPVWRRPWFLALCGVALIALLAAAHRLRVRRLLEVERVRTRIAGDLHDDLGASLARVSLLSEAARQTLHDSPAAAEPILAEIGETSRALVGAAGDIAYSIDPGRGDLDGLVARLRRFAEELLGDAEIAWHIEVIGETAGVELSADQRRHALAILKEGLHNAVRHGRPRHLTLRVAVGGHALTAELIDDGRGFSAGVPDTGAEPPAGQGLRSMRRRARELRGRLLIDSEPGAGTRLTLRVPL